MSKTQRRENAGRGASSPHRPPSAGDSGGASGRHGMRSIVLVLIGLLILAFVLARIPGLRRAIGRPGAPTESAPNILLITLDTTRADHLGTYGSARARTRHLDRLAAQGVRFERAISSAPITLPSHASILTGLYPFTHGVRNNGNFYLSDKFATLATTLRVRGYRTAAFVSSFILDRRYGLARGFELYDDQLDTGAGEVVNLEVERRGDRTALAAANWIERYARGELPATSAQPAASRSRPPFFLWLHLYDPHEPYHPPQPFRDAFADSPYDGEIAFDDAVIASVLDRLGRVGLAGDTLIAIVGDHGESLGDHGEETHSMFVYDAALRVPLILWWPGRLPAGRSVAPVVRIIDLAPTLLELAGAPAFPGVDGRSLVPLLRATGDGSAAREASGTDLPAAYGETYLPLLYMNWAPLRSIEDERWKFIDAPRPELYDLARDPHEMSNLAAREPARASAYKRALDALTGGGEGAMTVGRVDREAQEKLAALGYLNGGTAAGTAASGSRPDPKDMIGVFNRLRQANTAVREGRLAEAAPIARDVLARDPHNAFATIILASAQMNQGRYREALEGYKAYLTLVPSSAQAHHWLAICYLRLGEKDRALAEEDAALAIDSRYADAHVLRAGVLAGRGRHEEAIRELRAAIQTDPDKPALRVDLARVLVEAHRFDEAEAEYRGALELQPTRADAHTGLGVLLAERGRPDQAAAEFRRSLELEPQHDEARFDLAKVLEQSGRRDEARAQYERLAGNAATPAPIKRAAKERLRTLKQ